MPGLDISYDSNGRLIVSANGSGYQIEEKESFGFREAELDMEEGDEDQSRSSTESVSSYKQCSMGLPESALHVASPYSSH